MKKHAYLVIAHHQFEILMAAMKILDDVNNDFYIHIDAKVENFPKEKIQNAVTKSRIYFVDRLSVNWGGYSQIKCELRLLKAAVKNQYDYYHLISGVDLPIKSKQEIFRFFEENSGKEFVYFEKKRIQEKYLQRISRYYLFQEYVRRNTLCYYLQKAALILQKLFRINRIKGQRQPFQFGSNWFSITHKFAQYVLSKEKWIHHTFRFSTCGDELFLQTILIQSPFVEHLPENVWGDYRACLRYVDWKRGNPYIFTRDDFEELTGADKQYLFARKFDLDVDREIVRDIVGFISKKG